MSIEKQCFKCGEVKPLSDFYRHSGMADAHLNKCKECTKSDAKKSRKARIEYYREYDRNRGNRQDREYLDRIRKEFPNQCAAHRMVQRAIRAGRLFREACEVCGSMDSVHAHHDDYSKPLNVRWLCAAHHKQWHNENGPGLNR